MVWGSTRGVDQNERNLTFGCVCIQKGLIVGWLQTYIITIPRTPPQFVAPFLGDELLVVIHCVGLNQFSQYKYRLHLLFPVAFSIVLQTTEWLTRQRNYQVGSHSPIAIV